MAHTVLVVDDHASTVELIRDALATQGFEVITAGNGAECLATVELEQPDLVILDLKMPVLNGLDTLRLLRQGVADESLPVIMLSGRAHFADVRKAWKRGVDIYLTKPVRVGAVVAAVKWLLEPDDETTPAPRSEAARGPALGALVGSDHGA
jgi:DNA-binding response OmpR family regulator